MTTTDGIRSDSTGIPDGKTPDSALRGEERRTGNPTSSRSEPQRRIRASESDEAITERIRSIAFADALAAIIIRIRPSWSPVLVRQWALTDPRADDVIVRAGIAGAADRGIKYPTGLTQVGPQLEISPTPPPAPHEHRAYLKAIDKADCGHGDLAEKCALCRHRLPALEAE